MERKRKVAESKWRKGRGRLALWPSGYARPC